jgi:acetyltransferase-like isoleucine patch superfamily enzyme
MIEIINRAVQKSGLEIGIAGADSFEKIQDNPDVIIQNDPSCDAYVAGPVTFKGKPAFTLRGENCNVFLDKGCILDRTRLILGGNNLSIYIGKKVRIKNGIIKINGDSCCVVIGDTTTWESGTMLCSGEVSSIVVGQDCMLSNNILLRTDDGHGIFDRETRERINTPSDIVLEDHVWIGNGARVNKGTRIGQGTVLGGASIASRTLEPNSIYAGVPAKQLRTGIAWSRSTSFDGIPERYR